MKIVTVCEEGINRSVAAKWLIQFRNWQGHREHELISMGLNCLSEESRQMLYDWADRVILLDARFVDVAAIPAEKFVLWDVGPDRYFKGDFHPELIAKLKDFGRTTEWPPRMEIEEEVALPGY